ncbi:MFS transporter [Defluviimonas sp. D31]|uniref:MFS transporter n=1 Tax=Defluviimonas sp. D31 TaxID=3083253 RepID=UPI00296ECDA1|nr:MFS transporter [Defluviimonas sp. D31]MDW4548223.1 MFS transporter [Defluviimonas sp. D31]
MVRTLPKGVVALGLVSLFMDVSSEMIHALLPLFLTGTLGATALAVGLIEGAGEAVAQIVKVFSGVWSDRIGRRKPLLIMGYGLAALTKPVFAVAGGAGTVLAARMADRIGKGIRGAPRDALVADLVPEAQRGAAYGLRQSLDTAGAFLGPLLAIALMLLSGGDIRLVFAVAVLPAVLAVLVLWRGVSEPPRHDGERKVPPRLDRRTLAALGPAFWRVAAFGAALSFARISEAFLILKSADAGLAPAWAPAVFVLMNLIYAVVAWPAGALSDRVGQGGLLRLSILTLVAAHLIFAATGGLAAAFLGIALWGLHMGLSQGLLSAAIARAAPAELRGTAFGAFNLMGGIATLGANVLAGGLWTLSGPGDTFAAAAAAAFAALLIAPRCR